MPLFRLAVNLYLGIESVSLNRVFMPTLVRTVNCACFIFECRLGDLWLVYISFY